MTTVLEHKTHDVLNKVVQWHCGSCDEYHEGEIPESEYYYDTNDLINEITDRGPIKVTDLDDMAKRFVTEVNLVRAPCGLVDEDEASDASGWRCPECNDPHDSAHAARDCCLVHDVEDPEDDTCLRFCNIDASTIEEGWSYCFCDSEDDNECMVKVCLTCHAEMRREEEMKEHLQIHRETASYDEDVDIPVPEHLPPAFEYVEVADIPVAGCEMCSSDYCCEFHGIHKTPHRGHAG